MRGYSNALGRPRAEAVAGSVTLVFGLQDAAAMSQRLVLVRKTARQQDSSNGCFTAAAAPWR